MRKIEALRAARRFVRARYPELRECYLEVTPELGLDRPKSRWSFGVHIDSEDAALAEACGVEAGHSYTGYVHASGHVEGLY